MSKFLLSVFIIFLTVTFNGQARADYFVWQDVTTGLSLSFPDTWRMVNNAKPDDLLTVMAPSGEGQATCRVRHRKDGRYKIFPYYYDESIQKISYSKEFLEQYFSEYSEYKIYISHDEAGLGRGYAGYAVAGYRSAVPGPMTERKALMFASLYHDNIFILECSSQQDVFEDWKDMFLSIAKSIDFKKIYSETVVGNYRNFTSDP